MTLACAATGDREADTEMLAELRPKAQWHPVDDPEGAQALSELVRLLRLRVSFEA